MENPTFTALITFEDNAGYFLPDRHFLPLGRDHKQLFSIMIEKLQSIDRIGHIVINTDSQRIRSYYDRQHGFTVINTLPVRTEETPMDLEFSPDHRTAAMLDKAPGEHFLQLGSIFPFVQQRTIESAIDTYDRYVVNPEDWSFDSVFSVRNFYRKLFDNDRNVLRNDPPNVFIEDGILHLFNRTTFQQNGKQKVGPKPFAVGIDEIENLAIDSDEHHVVAGLIADNRHRFPALFGR